MVNGIKIYRARTPHDDCGKLSCASCLVSSWCACDELMGCDCHAGRGDYYDEGVCGNGCNCRTTVPRLPIAQKCDCFHAGVWCGDCMTH
jgi:hypothetical protein